MDTYLAYCESVPSPPQFKLWAGIAAVAGALERRVWVKVYAGRVTFANLFVTLVAPPGIGKGVIEETAHLWRNARDASGKLAFHIAPDSVTSAALLLELKDANRVIIRGGQLLHEYHTLLVASEELGFLLPSHDLEFLSRLNYIFNNPPYVRVRRVYLKDVVEILQPQLTILAGTQPGYLASLLPEEAWGMGYTSRLIMIYAGVGPNVELFVDDTIRHEQERALLDMMRDMAELSGLCKWDPRAAELLTLWNSDGRKPVPDHPRLVHYNNRRLQYVIKLAIVSAISRARELAIRQFDIERALTWLCDAERTMPDIFREMVNRSDASVLQELHLFAWREWLRSGKKPLPEAALIGFLRDRVPSEKLLRVLEIAERSDMLARVAGESAYVPRPHSQFNMTAV